MYKYSKNIAITLLAISVPALVLIGIADGYNSNISVFKTEQSMEFGSQLIDSADVGDAANVNKLLQNGANVNEVGRFGATALLRAVYRGNYNLSEILIKSGANINQADIGGASPLHIAIRKGHGDVAQLIIENGGNINAKDGDGWTPIMRATSYNMSNIVQYLIESGAQVDLSNNYNQTAFDIAQQNGNSQIIELFNSVGYADKVTKNNDYSQRSAYNPTYSDIYSSKSQAIDTAESNNINFDQIQPSSGGVKEYGYDAWQKSRTNQQRSNQQIAEDNTGYGYAQVEPVFDTYPADVKKQILHNNELDIKQVEYPNNAAIKAIEFENKLRIQNQQHQVKTQYDNNNEISDLKQNKEDLIAEITRKTLAAIRASQSESTQTSDNDLGNHYLPKNDIPPSLESKISTDSKMDQAVIGTAKAHAASILAEAQKKAAEIELATQSANIRIKELMIEAQKRAKNKMQDADKVALQKINDSQLLAKQKIVDTQKYIDNEKFRLNDIKRQMENEILQAEVARKEKLRNDLLQVKQELSKEITKSEQKADSIIQQAQVKAKNITSYADDYVKDSASQLLSSIIKEKSAMESKLKNLNIRTENESKKLSKLEGTLNEQTNQKMKTAQEQIINLRDRILDEAEQEAITKIKNAQQQAQLIIDNAKQRISEQNMEYNKSIKVKQNIVDKNKIEVKKSNLHAKIESEPLDNTNIESNLSSIAPASASPKALSVNTRAQEQITRSKVQMADAIRVPVKMAKQNNNKVIAVENTAGVKKLKPKIQTDKSAGNNSLFIDDYVPFSSNEIVNYKNN